MANGANKRIAMFLDGTWNEPGDNTNVWRMKLMVADRDDDGARQITYYDTGVGTKWYERFRGGAFATGLSKNVREAYQWLMENYDDGDEVFVFGFSRGAYTARSLTGMIAKCGLLRPGAPMPVVQVFERYARGAMATPLWTLEFQKKYKDRTDFSLEESWLLEYAKRIDIQFIGVWDTVGTLGVPIGRIKGISRSSMYYHHIRLSKIFKNTFQALAIDEHRKPYRPALWTKFIPKQDDDENAAADADPEETDPHIEQRWFIGAHSNIGGGYRNDPLAQVPLEWLQQKAKATGLHFRNEIRLDGSEHLAPVVDSFAQFLKGFYRILRLGRRYYRVIGWPREEKATGFVETVNESIDSTVFDRWRQKSEYRPKNLVQWAERKGLDPGTIDGTTAA